jgi:hypothetical protein
MKSPAKKIPWLLLISIALLLLSPLISHWIWVLKPAKLLNIILIDKTVSDQNKNEHASFTWLLNNLKVEKSSTKTLYALDDYYGFFHYPMNNFMFPISKNLILMF